MRRACLIALTAAGVLGGCGESESGSDEPTTISVSAPSGSTTTAGGSTAPAPADDSAGDPSAADDPGADRPRSVEDVVTAVLTGSETPGVICDELVTPDYVTTAYGDRAGCIAAQRPGALADSVTVAEVEQAGARASAVAVPAGGPYDGVDVEVDLVAAGDLEDAWLIDSLLADVPAGP